MRKCNEKRFAAEENEEQKNTCIFNSTSTIGSTSTHTQKSFFDAIIESNQPNIIFD